MELLLIALVSLLILGVPVSFSLIISSTIYLVQHDISIFVAIQRMTMSIGDSFTLISVPFFILAGVIMNTGGITEKIFDFADKLVGHITGGLGHANILASIIFSGMSGTAIADAGGLGAIELKAMRDAGYDEDFSLAITGASSIIGPIIPPSVPAVLYAVLAGASVGRLFIAGIVPGIIMGLIMSLFVFLKCKNACYPVSEKATLRERWESFKESFLALLTPVIIIGGLLSGIFTPTEAAVVAVAYSLALGIYYKNVTLSKIKEFLRATAAHTVSVMLIVAGASIFGWILTIEQVPQLITNFFLNNVESGILAILLINLLLLVVGTFLETIAAITILTPILVPLALSFGFDLTHFGIIMILNLMIGLLTPPLGMVLYVLSSVSEVPFERIVKATTPYVFVLALTLLIFTSNNS